MSKTSSSKLIIRNLHHYISSPQNAASSGASHFFTRHPGIPQTPIPSPWLSQRTHFSSSPFPKLFQSPTRKLDLDGKLAIDFLSRRNLLGFRWFSMKGSELGAKMGGVFGKNGVKIPVGALKNTVSRYKEAVGLQIDAFWKRNSLVLFGGVGVMVCILLWKLLFGIANTFIGLSEGMAKYGFLALSTAIVAFAGLYIRTRFTINPDKVYRMAMRRLNTSAGILEVMGAPLTGTDLRAYVMSGGGVTLKNFKPRFRSKRCFLIFPMQGSERKGLVSVEVKNKKGQYDMKLLAVDIPMVSGPDQRLYLIGDEEEYRVGGGLISELRDPVVKAMAASKEFEDLDQLEDEEDEERKRQEAERRHREEIEKIEKRDS
nr:Extensin like [Ipomoea batatas]GMC65716.1 Extensin like [Ipomoea batatas]